MKKTIVLASFILLAALAASTALAGEAPGRTKGQEIYIPAYSHIYHGPKKRPIPLLIMLSFRNTDARNSITITRLDYYDSSGKKKSAMLKEPKVVAPMATEEVFIDEDDDTGGSGANFILGWKADALINPPYVEAIMISTINNLGIVFNCPGRVLSQ